MSPERSVTRVSERTNHLRIMKNEFGSNWFQTPKCLDRSDPVGSLAKNFVELLFYTRAFVFIP